MPQKDLHEANRISWNEATKAHNSHRGDQAAFFRNGGSTLFPEEIELLGDVRGRTVLHLQCNAGQDTLSIASQLGGVVTGVDISDEAIEFARRLSAESHIPAAFIRSDIYDWFDQNTAEYDAIFSSYGALTWLSDLSAWGRGIAAALKPGGLFVLMEFHPVFGMFEVGWALTFDYMGGKHIAFDVGVGDYVAETGSIAEGEIQPGIENFSNPHPSHEFCWGTGDIVGALLDAGLTLVTLREYPYSNGYKRFADMCELPGRRFTMPEGKPIVPMMLGIVAEKR